MTIETVNKLISSLENALPIIGATHFNPDSITPGDAKILSAALNTYIDYYPSLIHQDLDPRIENYRDFVLFIDVALELIPLIEEFEKIKSDIEKSRESKSTTPEQNIPEDIENLVTQYRDHQKDLEQNDGSAGSVAAAVARAREAMLKRERLEAIHRNRAAALQQDPAAARDQNSRQVAATFVTLGDPKSRTYQDLFQPTTTAINQTVSTYLESYISSQNLSGDEATRVRALTNTLSSDVLYLVQSGSIGLSEIDLVTAVQVAHFRANPAAKSPISDLYQSLNQADSDTEAVNKQANQVQLQLSRLSHQFDEAQSKAEQQQILEQIQIANQQAQQLEAEKLAIHQRYSQLAQSNAATIEAAAKTNLVYTRADGTTDPDRDLTLQAAHANATQIMDNLAKNRQIHDFTPPETNPLRLTSQLESAIRKELPELGLATNTTQAAAEMAVFLTADPKKKGDLSAESVQVFGKGLSTKQLDQVIAYAEAHKNDEKSALGKLFKTNSELFGHLRKQITTIEKTDTPEAQEQRVRDHIAENSASPLATLQHQSKEAYQKYLELKKLDPKALGDFISKNPNHPLSQIYKNNRKLFSAVEKNFHALANNSLAKEIGRKVSTLDKFANSGINRLASRISPSSATSTSGFQILRWATDPVGSAKSWLGKKAGNYVLNKVSSRIGSEALKEVIGKVAGVKTIAKDLLKKATEKAIAAGIRMAASSGFKLALEGALSATGVGIIAAIAVDILWSIGEKIFGAIGKAINDFKQATANIYGSEVDAKDLAIGTAGLVAAPVIAAATAGLTVINGILMATRAAAASATATIAVTSFILFFLYVSAIVTAPLISTLAQLESTPKTASYNASASGDCIWPIKEHSTVTQGPLGLFSHARGVQGIDILPTNHYEVHSVGSGTVAFAGFYSPSPIYGNLIIVRTTTSVGTFDVWYAHLSEIGVNSGDPIAQDQVIGLTGNVGEASWVMADHLHMEYRGIAYNDCPAGGVPVPETCVNDYISNTGVRAPDCKYNGNFIYTDTQP